MKTPELLELSAKSHLSAQNRQVATQFSKAALRYDKYALVQKDVAEHAITLHLQATPSVVNCLEIGCGTGLHLSSISAPCEHYWGLDISGSMLSVAKQRGDLLNGDKGRPNIHFVNADAQHLPFADYSIDCVYSSMALQWLDSPTQAMSEVNRVLITGGNATLAIMVQGSFYELDNAWSELDLPSRVNRFYAADEWTCAAESAGMKVSVEVVPFTQYFDSSLAMLKSLKAIGANTVLEQHLSAHLQGIYASSARRLKRLSKTELAALDRVMQKQKNKCTFNVDAAMPLTYQIAFLQLQSAS